MKIRLRALLTESKIQVTENLGFGAPSGVATGTNTPTNSTNTTSSGKSFSKNLVLKDPVFSNKKKNNKNINENYVPNLETISKNFDYINMNKIDQNVRDYAYNYGVDINNMNLHLYEPDKQMQLVKNKHMGIK